VGRGRQRRGRAKGAAERMIPKGCSTSRTP
jgi:hypothetical protein